MTAAGWLQASPAAADQAQDFFTAGLLMSLASHANVHGDRPARPGFGVESTFVHYLDRPREFGVGGFTQAQIVGTDHARFALGPQLNYVLLGLELGGYIETSSPGHAATWGAHLGPFLSLGVVSAAFRVGLPLGTIGAGGRDYGLELGAVAVLKFPYPVGGSLLGNILR
jgi:hypothetical protein